ncbi:MAG: 30S ribosomal protein S6 [Dehalococcoidia bacterium]
MNEYELIYIVTPRKAPAEVEQVGAWIAEQVTGGGGEVLSTRTWGRRRMAYPIAHNLDGTYVIARLRMPAAVAVSLERALHIQEDVIRHMLIRGIMGTDDPPPEFMSERPRFAPRPMPMDRGEMRPPPPPVEAAPAPADEAPSAPAAEAEAPSGEAAGGAPTEVAEAVATDAD